MAAPTAIPNLPPFDHIQCGARRGSRIEVPPGISLEEARRVLSAVASSAGTVARTGRTLTLDIGPAKRKGESRFHITKALHPKPPAVEAEAERPEADARRRPCCAATSLHAWRRCGGGAAGRA